ncbi:nuclear transport factor 2 family protein [Francisella noatunensis]|uniref:Nuclear transport factor 2 family protein n=1 Tax=Francisella noatunensis TaxID=657445 RepID=A0A9Q2KT36_9GAMM|nr:nuclear transport factor 2 family protein [Francisella noatunensis]MBK2029352.1 nuclear transport factor 2 family protein [Francisella noatunensis]MBK2033884.1 nuclear transport factor 2 family protein [Francisella noatunensis]MBK2049332.1 nuclear transport factor 2 family protein [Francisella noatunensis]MBK2050669.1 nuclear transport factor 2 family protein [Francisella noatunensis]MBK2052180.1 nuclear transport factor 2 family protein [Francisella noatunensis]
MIFLSQQLLSLEESLLSHETRFDYKYMSRILTDDFKEFGKSGYFYSKKDILDSIFLPAKIGIKIVSDSFEIDQLDKHIVLVTYKTINLDSSQKQHRCSIWIKVDNDWKMKFHQGNIMED